MIKRLGPQKTVLVIFAVALILGAICGITLYHFLEAIMPVYCYFSELC